MEFPQHIGQLSAENEKKACYDYVEFTIRIAQTININLPKLHAIRQILWGYQIASVGFLRSNTIEQPAVAGPSVENCFVLAVSYQIQYVPD